MAGDPTDSFRSRLTPLQRDVLAAFFARDRGFFLTGGAALAGYHLGHRETLDLDLFATDAGDFERGRFILVEVASALGATLQVRQEAPGFRRVVLDRGGELVVIDTVLDPIPQLVPEKPDLGGVRVDPPREILVNKLCAVVGRAEERDLVDLWALERSGLSIEDALADALAKDGGCTPATLAWLLDQVVIPDHVQLPGDVPAQELRDWLAELVPRLRQLAHPGR
ncbi:MAG: nucleotidyl transferase AbiEii/AbiGii toxin family protein [Deltaproteobacteria bacterium]|nr:nucleotidyl transferase AbiEii/AbiGii toxin family protein [Nannocystaceae bacterium]